MGICPLTAALGAKTGAIQSQIGATILKNNADSERSTVLTLLGAAQSSSQANLGAGVGGKVDTAA